MKINEVSKIDEDPWLTQKLKKVGTGLGAKALPKGLGGAKLKGKHYIEKRTEDLYNTWKEAEGTGLEKNINNIERWLRSGDSPASPQLLRQAKQASNILSDQRNLSNSELRDYFRSIAQAEARTTSTGTGSPAIKQSQQQRAAKSPKKSPTKDSLTTGRSDVNKRLQSIESQVAQIISYLQNQQ